jgi:large subunit ribosomal protein L10
MQRRFAFSFHHKGGVELLAITNEKKRELVETYVDLLENSNAIVFLHSRGLTVAEVTALRTKIRDAGSKYHVVKNTLFERALGQVGMPVPKVLAGPVSVAFCSEAIATTVKAIQDAAKTLDQREFEIIGGIMDNQVLNVAQANALASLPSKEMLFAQLLAGINAPAAQLVGVVASGLRQVASVLQARVDQLKEGEAAA